jgi:hypothetical protein
MNATDEGQGEDHNVRSVRMTVSAHRTVSHQRRQRRNDDVEQVEAEMMRGIEERTEGERGSKRREVNDRTEQERENEKGEGEGENERREARAQSPRDIQGGKSERAEQPLTRQPLHSTNTTHHHLRAALLPIVSAAAADPVLMIASRPLSGAAASLDSTLMSLMRHESTTDE